MEDVNKIFSTSPNEVLFKDLFLKLDRFTEEEKKLIRSAAYFADNAHRGQMRASGDPYIIHPIAVGELLVDLGMDAESVCAGLMHDVIEDTQFDGKFIAEHFSPVISNLVEGVTKIDELKSKTKGEDQEAETIRKMFFAMSDDPRVIIIKLSDKMHNMKTLQYLKPHRAREIARECLEIYAPLADRLGINKLKNDLEDESLKIISPDTFKMIDDYISSKKSEQLLFLKNVEDSINKEVKKYGINVEISSRIKHNYSIFTKMKRRAKDIKEIYDIYGTRVICSTITECYTILGIVHSLWSPIEGRFKDYIAMPKANSYQSLHTTVVGPSGKLLEIQIRTQDMELTANFGMASHWAYKAQTGRQAAPTNVSSEEGKIYSQFVDRMKNWKDEIKASESFMDDIKSELLQDSIIVFTPKGKAIELPVGSTALDFAYSIHTDIGHSCYQAKVNDQIIPLSQPLLNTQIVEIVTNKNAHPKESWLKYTHTQSARRKIKSWLNKNDENIIFGRNLIVKNIQEAGKNGCEKFKFLSTEEIVKEVDNRNSKKNEKDLTIGESNKNFMIHFAHCCSPVKGDEIVGYVSRGRGIIVHKKDCPNLVNMPEFKERRIDVHWEDDNPVVIKKFKLVCRRAADIFSEIEKAIKRFGACLVEGKVNDDGVNLVGTFSLECKKNEDIGKIIKAISELSEVETATVVDN